MSCTITLCRIDRGFVAANNFAVGNEHSSADHVSHQIHQTIYPSTSSSALPDSAISTNAIPSSNDEKMFHNPYHVEDEVDIEVDDNGNVHSVTIRDESDPLNSGATAPNSKDMAPEPERTQSFCEKDDVNCGRNLPQLPVPSFSSAARSIRVGESIKLDELGPLVVNYDGTLRRIANWNIMTKQEQRDTLRIISARNKKRLEALENPVIDQS